MNFAPVFRTDMGKKYVVINKDFVKPSKSEAMTIGAKTSSNRHFFLNFKSKYCGNVIDLDLPENRFPVTQMQLTDGRNIDVAFLTE